MKILFTSENYFPNVSGVPVVVKYLAEGLAERGHAVSIVTCLFESKIHHECLNGVDIYRFDVYHNIAKVPVGKKKEYVDFIVDFNPDILVIECTQCITTDILLPHISKLKCKIIFHSHGFSGLEIKRPFALCDGFLHTIGHTYNWIRSQFYFSYWLKKYANRFDASLVLSNMDSGKPFLDNILGDKNYILGNAADDMFFCQQDESYNPLSQYVKLKCSRYCFSCANYTVVKNQKEMIREFYQVSEQDCALVCVGGQNTLYFDECKDLVSQLNKKYGEREVHLLHHVDRKHIPAIMRHAYLYIVTSTFEQYSISIIEAMSQGVPFISTNVGNARLLPGGKTIKHITDLHSSIEDLIKDKDKWQSFSNAGIDFAYKNCRIDTAVDNLEYIIYKTMNS